MSLEGKYTETASGCWIWQKGTNNLGYGRVTFEGRQVYAHRLSAFRAGLLPSMNSSDSVCHKCDQPSCVNPEHLFVGSHSDNMNDKIRKGRATGPAGERHAKTKLTNSDVLKIYSHPPTNWSELARSFGVGPQTVYNIRKGRTWTHITGHRG